MERYPTTILLATDGSADAQLAEKVAVDLCARSGAQLHLVHAWLYVPAGTYPYSGITMAEVQRRFRADGEAILAASAERIARAGGTVTGQHLQLGSPPAEIVALSEKLDADLVLLGSRGLGTVRRLVVGSVSDAVVHSAQRPTLVLRGGEAGWPPARIVIGDDGSADADRAAKLGLALGRLYRAEAILVRTIPELPLVRWYEEGQRARIEKLYTDEAARAHSALEANALRLASQDGSVPGVTVMGGDAAAVLLDVAESGPTPALIAVGCRGLGPLGRLRLGSVSTTILHAAHGPVLVVPRRPA
jgi:nucleotide-binding universal stress UspA family protein